MSYCGPRAALVHEGHRLRSSHVSRLDLLNGETRTLDEIANRPVQVTTATDALPHWCQSILPLADILLRGASVLDK